MLSFFGTNLIFNIAETVVAGKPARLCFLQSFAVVIFCGIPSRFRTYPTIFRYLCCLWVLTSADKLWSWIYKKNLIYVLPKITKILTFEHFHVWNHCPADYIASRTPTTIRHGQHDQLLGRNFLSISNLTFFLSMPIPKADVAHITYLPLLAVFVSIYRLLCYAMVIQHAFKFGFHFKSNHPFGVVNISFGVPIHFFLSYEVCKFCLDSKLAFTNLEKLDRIGFIVDWGKPYDSNSWTISAGSTIVVLQHLCVLMPL